MIRGDQRPASDAVRRKAEGRPHLGAAELVRFPGHAVIAPISSEE